MLTSLRNPTVIKVLWAAVFVAFVIGFLLFDSSGLIGGAVTPQTPVAEVDGEEILYTEWEQLSRQLAEQQQQQLGRPLTLDEQRIVEGQALDQLIADRLLQEEIQRRGIIVTDQEIRQYAQFAPPPWLASNPDLFTEGRFDIDKYRRLLGSPVARQQGLLLAIERYYRDELPKQKLLDQVANTIYLTDAQLWQIWQDQNDSASVSFVALSPALIADSAVQVTNAEIERYYEAHQEELERPGRAIVSLVNVARELTAADTIAVRNRLLALRQEILGGASFAEVAQRESTDSISAAQGGSLGAGVRGRFVPEFEEAAFALREGEVSQPVLTSFGYHLIRADDRRGDTLEVSHILLPIQQRDSAALVVDRRADSLATIAGGAENPARLDSAAQALGLPITRGMVVEGDRLIVRGAYVPSVSAWAFDGARPGEISDLFDDERGYWMARLDSIVPGGVPPLSEVREDIRRVIAREKKVEALRPRAAELASAAAASSLEQAAAAQGLEVSRTGLFTRGDAVPGLGRFTRAIGAAFGLPVGAVSQPIATDDAVYVLRVERRVPADRAAFETQKEAQRGQLTQALRQRRIQEYVRALREEAEVEDYREEINEQLREQQAVI